MNEEKRKLLLLQKLSRLPEFQEWRDALAKPLITQWEAELQKADTLPEVIVRANLKHLYTLKALFYDWFEIVDEQVKDINEEEKKGT